MSEKESEEMSLVDRTSDSPLDPVSETTLNAELVGIDSDESEVDTGVSDEIAIETVTELKLDELE